jgi:hypothetical protein
MVANQDIIVMKTPFDQKSDGGIFVGFGKHRPIYRPKLPNVSQRVLHFD